MTSAACKASSGTGGAADTCEQALTSVSSHVWLVTSILHFEQVNIHGQQVKLKRSMALAKLDSQRIVPKAISSFPMYLGPSPGPDTYV